MPFNFVMLGMLLFAFLCTSESPVSRKSSASWDAPPPSCWPNCGPPDKKPPES